MWFSFQIVAQTELSFSFDASTVIFTTIIQTGPIGFGGTLVSTTAIEDATCESLKNDPTLNIISCCTSASIHRLQTPFRDWRRA